MALFQPDESALELFARLRSRPVALGVRAIDAAAPGGFVAGDVVEVSGPSGSGKTMLLVAIAARLATEEARGGARVDVLYLDMDGRAPLHRLATCVERELANAAGGTLPDEALVLLHLSRVRIGYCASALQLVAAVAAVRSVLPEREAGAQLVLLIDGLGASFWLDKLEFSQAKRSGHPYDRLAQPILDIARARKALVVVATTELFDVRKEGVAPALSRRARVRAQVRPARCGRGIELAATAAAPRPPPHGAARPPAAAAAGAPGAAVASAAWARLEFSADGGMSGPAAVPGHGHRPAPPNPPPVPAALA
ncbi:hypothetical protein KFE25_013805 [Diacronema lutheri]|uniref:AAA+ ATPase domain-containing protein n=1 Tax=Diacronema lutheri TaxID=2081491 RepID=A0A8J5XUN4_DIALT|nr:hypothetical protein KFE25_013805 [Diacronema lutheri]